MKKILFIILCAIMTLASCDDTTGTLGMEITNSIDVLSASDGTFKITSRSIAVDSVLSRSSVGYLGKVKDPETGAYVSSDFLTQFTVLGGTDFDPVDSLREGIKADSCNLRFFYDSYYGDSLTAMKATLYELRKPAEENVNYYTTFDPEKLDMVRVAEGAIKQTKVYSLVNKNYSDSLRWYGDYTNNISFDLNQPYTSVDGKTYDNYGTYIMAKYYENPENFRSPYKFNHNVCPGFYVKLDNGLGAMAYISNTRMNVYYRTKSANMGHAFGGTEEVLQLTKINIDRERINQLVADNTCTYIKAPASIFTEMTLPVEEICKGHETDSITSAKVVLKCFTRDVDSEFTLKAPSTILMLEKDSLNSFFENKEVADYRKSFTAQYSSSKNTYTFNNIGHIIKRMYNLMPQDATQREEWKRKHPNWNKVVLVPVNASYTTYNTTSILTSLAHDLGMSSVRLVGGPDSQDGDIEVSVIYSRFEK